MMLFKKNYFLFILFSFQINSSFGQISDFFDHANFSLAGRCKEIFNKEVAPENLKGLEISIDPGLTLTIKFRIDPTISDELKYKSENDNTYAGVDIYDITYSGEESILLYNYRCIDGGWEESFNITAASKPIKIRIKGYALIINQRAPQYVMRCPCEPLHYVAGIQLPNQGGNNDRAFNDIQMIFYFSNTQNK